MCSIFNYKNCVGRNFDYEVSYNEEIRIIDSDEFDNDYKIIGMATGFVKDYPLLYDGMNQHGLCVSALAFEGNAVYNDDAEHKNNIPSYEFPLKILGEFQNVSEVKDYLEDVNITNKAYSEDLSSSDLHWFICDENESIILEQTKDGLHWYDGDIMTNNPPYPQQLDMNHSSLDRVKDYPELPEEYNSRGMETYGLLGDYTSMTRFSRLDYLKKHFENSDDAFNPVAQAFHLLSSVEQVYGATPVNDKFEYTIYSIVYDMKHLKAYLKFYDDLSVQEFTL